MIAIQKYCSKIEPFVRVVGTSHIASSSLEQIRNEFYEFFSDVISGDKGYDSENLHEILFQKGILFHAPVRDFNVKRPKGKHRRRCLQPYPNKGMGNIAESVIRSIKVRLRNLKSKNHWMKKRDLAWAYHNL